MGKGFINVPEELEPPAKSRSGAKPSSGGKFYENIPAKSNANPSATVRSTATNLPAKIDPGKDTDSLLESKDMKPLKKGGKVSSASKRADGIAQRGKTKGRVV